MKATMTRMALLLCAALVAAVLGAAPAAAAAAENGKLAVEDLKSLVATIEDEAERKRLLGQLRALIAAQDARAKQVAPTDGLGARFIAALSENIRETSRQLVEATDTLADLPLIVGWLERQATDEESRERWLRLLVKLAIILGCGVVAEHLTRRLLARPKGALEGREADGLLVRAPFLVGRTFLDLVPIAVFGAVAYAVAPLTDPEPTVYVVALTVINAYLVAGGALVAARMVFVPAAPSLRMLPLDGETAGYLYVWTRRLTLVAVVGYFLAEALTLLGLKTGGYNALLRLVGLVLGLLAAVFIFQVRRPVRDWLGGDAGADDTDAGQALQYLRRRFADVWHVLAVVYVAVVFGVWAVGVEGGFEFLARATAASALVLVVTGLALGGLRRAVDRGFAVGDELSARYPGLEARANRYLPVLHVTLKWIIVVAASIAFLQAWGLDALSLLETPLGERVMKSLFSLAIVLIVALMVWELVNSAIERYLRGLEEGGETVERSARARTLLPLLRNAVLVVLWVLVGLIVLSELGVNIGPLLAGAGVIGLAVGFGAQKLVQDVITGAFILFEDSISVGDVVSVGGNTGLVERLSIRSIRLRDLGGNVYTIPFSTVDTVTNMTKEFSYALFEVGVAYRENTDEVSEVLTEVADELMEDPELGPLILEPLEVLGVDKFADSAVVIKARLKTQPVKQWMVGREFNRRMKMRFDELGIEIPFPHTTLYFGEDKDGQAPPARFRIEEKGANKEMPARNPRRRSPRPKPSAQPDD